MIKFLTCALSASLCFSLPAFGQVIVQGGGDAKTCYDKTLRGDIGRKTTLRLCERALLDFDLQGKNKAATHINTAILYMRSADYAQAGRHYQKAIDMRPDLSEAYISLAANHIYQGEYTAAIDAVNKGIALDTPKMPEALYNRAIAYDRMDQYSLAYKDLKRVLTLRPDWEPAQKAISNYEVVAKPG